MGNPIFAAGHIIEKLRNEVEAWQEALAQYMCAIISAEGEGQQIWDVSDKEYWRNRAKECMESWLKIFDEQREEEDTRDEFQKIYEEQLVATSIKEIHEYFADRERIGG